VDHVQFRMRVFLAALFGVMVLGTVGFMQAEGLSLVDALYFCIVTIATVGYGDIHPMTQVGKLLAVALIITGVGTFLGVVANATEVLLNKREGKVRVQKLNMVIGVFFSEIGIRLLSRFYEVDPHLEFIKESLLVRQGWTDRDFQELKSRLQTYRYEVDAQKMPLEDLRKILQQKGSFLLRLWENPNLLEHESFTEVLRAVFHLREELLSRGDLTDLPETDRAHLAGDVKRAYALLANQWVDYMKHLKAYYPYLFSLAMRTNPFDPAASAVVT
jgi:voltage-gated potassium channel